MIKKGSELYEFITSLNGDAPVELTLAETLVDMAKTILEEERSWMCLRKTNSSKTVTTANTWLTAIDISTITDFSKFYGDYPVRLFDGNNKIQYYRQVPFDQRLEFKDASDTFVIDENAKIIYLNGQVPFNGSLYLNYITTSVEIDLQNDTNDIWTLFPPRFIPLLAFYAIGIFKGAIDYDSINKQMLPTNAEVLSTLKLALEKWDDSKQHSEVSANDPTDMYGGGFRNGAINRDLD